MTVGAVLVERKKRKRGPPGVRVQGLGGARKGPMARRIRSTFLQLLR